MKSNRLITPKRIIGVLFVILLTILWNVSNKIDNTSYNRYPEDSTDLEEEYGIERDEYVKTFIENLAENKYDEAYAMLSDSAKTDDFDSLEKFKTYFKNHIIDNTKVKKELTLRWNSAETYNNIINNYYNVTLYINPEEFAKVNATEEELISFYYPRSFGVTVLEEKPYDYKIFIKKPNIPLTKQELEEYEYNN